MLGFIFLTICFCAWLGKALANKERYYDDYKAKGLDKYGCWQDGHGGWHYGNKELARFYIGGHEVLAVPELLSYKNYSYTRWKYVVRDLTLEEQIRREGDEIISFHKDMKLRKKAIEEGKEFYEVNCPYEVTLWLINGESNKENLSRVYRRVDNNRLYFIYEDNAYNKNGRRCGYKYTAWYLKNEFLKKKKSYKGKWDRTLIRTDSEIVQEGGRGDVRGTWGFSDNGFARTYYLHD